MLRHGERDPDRLDLINVHQGHVIGLDHVALVNQQASDPAMDGRVDGTIDQLHTRVFYCRLVRFDGGVQGVGAGLHLVVLFFGHDPVLHQGSVTLGLDVSQFSLGVVLGQRALSLFQDGFKRTLVQGENQVAFFDILAFAEENAGQFSRDLGLHSNRGIRLDRADSLNLDRDILLLCGGGQYRNHRRGRRGWSRRLGTGASGQKQTARQAETWRQHRRQRPG